MPKLCRDSAVCCGNAQTSAPSYPPYFGDAYFWSSDNLTIACKLPQALEGGVESPCRENLSTATMNPHRQSTHLPRRRGLALPTHPSATVITDRQKQDPAVECVRSLRVCNCLLKCSRPFQAAQCTMSTCRLQQAQEDSQGGRALSEYRLPS